MTFRLAVLGLLIAALAAAVAQLSSIAAADDPRWSETPGIRMNADVIDGDVPVASELHGGDGAASPALTR